MSKYDGLRDALLRTSGTVTLSSRRMGRLVGGLPRSAYAYREWWSNEHAGQHVQAHAWLAAGRRVEMVDLASQRVRFCASGLPA